MIRDDLEHLLLLAINGMGYEFWGCEYLSQGKYSLLRVYIDKHEGITIDDCQEVSRNISAVLDVEDPIPGNYSLEISSPGIPRPLFKDWQYSRYIGHEVQIKTAKPINGKRKIVGIIVSVSEQSVVLDTEHQHQELFFSNIAKASLTS